MELSDRTIRVLEYDKILSMLAACAPTEGGAAMALCLRPSDERDRVLRRLGYTSDAKRLINAKGMPPFGSVHDVSAQAERAEKGAILNPRELLDIAHLLFSARQLSDYIRTDKLFDTGLDEIFARLLPNRSLEERITRAIPAEDLIADEASPELADIRRKIRNENNKIRDVLQKMVNGGTYGKYLQENIVTMRNGRYVVPVKAEHRSEVRGLVHDTSASGATVFIEPAGVVDANNELKVLEAKEKKEIERILYELSAECGNCSSTILLNYRNMTELSFYFACGSLSLNMRAECPAVTESRKLKLLSARHPLIAKEQVVPVNIHVEDGIDTMVITGPNTGGKTVTLKTVGLFSLMVQSGLHIPVSERSEIGVFDRVLADIGDEQSIEQSLSTFSAHMVNVVSILSEMTPRSLVLFDELGAGTDPVEGAALAVALLESVREKGAFCVATTHYAELKAFALETPGVINACCEFDVETLKPTYRLIIGTPGKSNAFAISEKLGIDKSIIDRAARLINSDSKRFENVIEKLEANRVAAEKDRAAAEAERVAFETYRREAEKEIEEARAAAKKARDDAEKKARQTIEGARASVSFVLDEVEKLRKAKASELSLEELAEMKRRMKQGLSESESRYEGMGTPEDDGYVLPRPLRRGDTVKLRNIGKTGELLSDPDKDGNVRVNVGGITTRTNIKNLKLIEKEKEDNRPESAKAGRGSVRTSAGGAFSPELDIRGYTGDDGWYAVDKYLDEALVAGIRQVSIIHGKGTGALKNYLWSWFRTDPRIASYRIGKYGEGDGGVTVIELK